MAHRIHVHAIAQLEPGRSHWTARVPALPAIVYGSTPEEALYRSQMAAAEFLRAYTIRFGAAATKNYLTGRNVRCDIESEDVQSRTTADFGALVYA